MASITEIGHRTPKEVERERIETVNFLRRNYAIQLLIQETEPDNDGNVIDRLVISPKRPLRNDPNNGLKVMFNLETDESQMRFPDGRNICLRECEFTTSALGFRIDGAADSGTPVRMELLPNGLAVIHSQPTVVFPKFGKK